LVDLAQIRSFLNRERCILVHTRSFFTNREGKLGMKNLFRIVIACGLLGGAALNADAQQPPGAHPGYLHALSDLRTARYYLSHKAGDPAVSANEVMGIKEIDAAIMEMKRAAIYDGKNVEDHPPVDVPEHGTRLFKAVESLRKARADAGQEEDNPQLQGLKQRIISHIDQAQHAADAAHAEWLRSVKQ
jgi:hypothetical protein